MFIFRHVFIIFSAKKISLKIRENYQSAHLILHTCFVLSQNIKAASFFAACLQINVKQMLSRL